MNGILLVNKPIGLTSHDVVYYLKKKFNLKKVGHTGTLDPFADGLLIILINNATKLAYLFDSLDKEYEGEIVFGNEYDTNDTTGNITDQKVADFNLEQLKQAIGKLMPSYSQIPPDYSAVKKDGVKAYLRAREGKPLKLKAREVNIYNFEIKKFQKSLTFKTKVSKGTYIRSIARDLGHSLNTYGSLHKLTRTKIDNYNLNDATGLEEITLNKLITDIEIFKNYPKVKFNDFLSKLIINGTHLDERNTNIEKNFVATNQLGEYLAYYEYIDYKYIPKYFFKKDLNENN